MQISTSNISKYRIGMNLRGRGIDGTVVRITANTAGATSGPGTLEIKPFGKAADPSEAGDSPLRLLQPPQQ